MALNADDIAAIAQQMVTLQAANPPVAAPAAPAAPAAASVAVKLPTFWPVDPTVWFAQAEAQFDIRAPPITADQTKFNYIVQALDSSSAMEVRNIIVNPPAGDTKYRTLKDALLLAFGKSQTAKDAEFLALSGLGDRKPSAFLRHMDYLNQDPNTLKRAFFLNQLPAGVRRILATSTAADLPELAAEADKIMEASTYDAQPAADLNTVRSNHTRPLQQQQQRGLGFVCRNHQRFGLDTYNCSARSEGCTMRDQVRPRPPSGNAPAGRR